MVTLQFPFRCPWKGSQGIFFNNSRDYGKTASTIFASVVRLLGKGRVEVRHIRYVGGKNPRFGG